MEILIETEDINAEVTAEEAILIEKKFEEIKELIRENLLFSNLKEQYEKFIKSNYISNKKRECF